MPVIEITSLEHPGVEVFSTLTEAQLRNRIDPQRGIFIAESPKVIRVALEAGYEPVSLLCERKHLTGDAAAMALTDRSVPLDYPPLKEEPRLALVMGTEGDGLPEAAIEGANYVVRIPMAHGVDSLNVAAASAVAFWELRCGENH